MVTSPLSRTNDVPIVPPFHQLHLSSVQRPLSTDADITAYNRINKLFEYFNENIAGLEVAKSKIWSLKFESTPFITYIDALINEEAYDKIWSPILSSVEVQSFGIIFLYI